MAKFYEDDSPDAKFENDEPLFDTSDFIMAFEDGQIHTIERLSEGFQHLIDTGQAWSLQGTYGRVARRLIDKGYCSE